MHADSADRLAIYQRLAGRNRLVAVLRIGVPALGIVLLASLLLQIYVSSLGSRFGVGRIAVTRDSITVDAPEYAGLLEDGSAYRVWATSAAAAADATDLIALTNAAMTLHRATGVTMQVNAVAAQLDTARQLVLIDGEAQVQDTSGTSGVFKQSEFDWNAQILTANGPVHIDYADGTTLDADGMVYDSVAMVWTFSNANVTLPDTPDSDPEIEKASNP